MRPIFSKEFDRSYLKLPMALQRKFDKQLGFLLLDIRHPSLRAKKYDEVNDIWQARVDQKYRFYFKIKDDVYILLDVIAHPR